MKKINRKRLNNKGFTLIELLAVVVILAVVMGIAMTSVLSSMNNSRKGSLQNSAKKVSQALQTKYSEAMVTNSTTNVYGDVLDTKNAEGATVVGGFNFSVSGFTIYTIPTGLKDEMNLSPSTYVLADAVEKLTPDADGKYAASTSFVAFDGDTMVVCLFAKQGGSYYVGDATKIAGTVTIGTKTITMDTDTTDTGNADMWACSTDGTQSW